MKSFHLSFTTTLLSCAMAALFATPATAFASDRGEDSAAASANYSRTEESHNKNLIQQLYRDMLSPVHIEEVGRYFAHDLIQHDPKLQDGRQAMQDAIQALRKLIPANTLTVKHVIADRDMVFVHAHLSATPGNELSGLNRYDRYRLDHGRIVEHWSLQDRVQAQTESGNSAFSDLYVYATPPAPVPEQRVEMNRLLVQALSEEVFGKRQFALLDRFWATAYIQHNPYVGNGRAALAEVLPYIAPEGSIYRVVESLSDNDLTLVCSQNQDKGSDPANEFSGYAVCDMYRVVNFELVEHWDIGQPVPPTTASGHSMFSNLYRQHR